MILHGFIHSIGWVANLGSAGEWGCDPLMIICTDTYPHLLAQEIHIYGETKVSRIEP